MSDQNTKDARYLYAIVPAATEVPSGLTGLGDEPVRLLVIGDIAAVVSEHDGSKIMPRRSNIATHQAVLRALAEGLAVLPMSFGTVADDEASLVKMLGEQQEELLESISQVGGCVEMGLRLSWDVANVYAHLVDRHPDLGSLRDELAAAGGGTRDQQMELGRQVDKVLGAERDAHANFIRETIDGVVRAVEAKDPREETRIVDFACLVPRDQVEAFESAVYAMADRLDDQYVFDLNGPWAPHHFVRLNLAV